MDREEFIVAVEHLMQTKSTIDPKDNATVEFDKREMQVQLYPDNALYIGTPGAYIFPDEVENFDAYFQRVKDAHVLSLVEYEAAEDKLDSVMGYVKSKIRMPVEYFPVSDSQLPHVHIRLPGTKIILADIEASNNQRVCISFGLYQSGWCENLEEYFGDWKVEKDIYVYEVFDGRLSSDYEVLQALLQDHRTTTFVRNLNIYKHAEPMPTLPFYERMFETERRTFVEFFSS